MILYFDLYGHCHKFNWSINVTCSFTVDQTVSYRKEITPIVKYYVSNLGMCVTRKFVLKKYFVIILNKIR